MARVALKWRDKRVIRQPLNCPSPIVEEGRLRLPQMQGVLILYASVLAASLGLAGFEWSLSCALARVSSYASSCYASAFPIHA